MSSDSDPVLQLGRNLADALDPSDIVGRWMSHHLAELINQCEENPHDAELSATTRGVVLNLWEHKSGAPLKSEPYAHIQPILRAIERLDPSPAPWAYYRPFDEQAPSAKAMATYPLLPVACDIDREVGQLIRLVVALTARDAMSCEEPWVMAGKDAAKTEEDIAVRTLEQLVRRLRYRTEEDTDEAPAVGSQATEAPAIVGRAANNESLSEPEAVGTNIIDAAENLGPSGPLSRSIQNSLTRCRRLLDQLSDMYGNAPGSEGSQTGPDH
jgi:hypothetical protein